MTIAALTAQLPTLAGSLPDLFRRPEASARSVDIAGARPDGTTANGDDRASQRAPGAGDDATRRLARRAALGPLTYGRRMTSTDTPTPAPAGLRGVHLDVRG
jgi:hypothetical protein